MRNGAGVGRSRGIRRYEMRTDIGERGSGYQMRSLETVDGSGNKRERRKGKEYGTRVDGKIYLRVYVEKYQKSDILYLIYFQKDLRLIFMLRVKIYRESYNTNILFV